MASWVPLLPRPWLFPRMEADQTFSGDTKTVCTYTLVHCQCVEKNFQACFLYSWVSEKQKQAGHHAEFSSPSPISSIFPSFGPEKRFCELGFIESKGQKETAESKRIVWHHIRVQNSSLCNRHFWVSVSQVALLLGCPSQLLYTSYCS